MRLILIFFFSGMMLAWGQSPGSEGASLNRPRNPLANPTPASNAIAPSQTPLETGASFQGIGEHVLTPGDTIDVRVFQEDELNTRTRVEADGTINLPLLGQLLVAGKTLKETTELIRKGLDDDFLYNPQVNVTILDFAKRRFAVLGQVNRPGFFEMPATGRLNLLQAIAMAGGYTSIAKPSDVTVKRVVKGQEVVISLNAKQMAKDKNSKVFELEPNDTITISESNF